MPSDKLLLASDVAVIVVNYNGSDDTIECIEALYKLKKQPGWIIIVDNGSEDNSIDRIYQAWSKFDTPKVINNINYKTNNICIIISLPINNGYAFGNNTGIEFALKNDKCKAVWILNNDTSPDQNALNSLCILHNKYNSKTIIGSTLIFSQDRKTVQCLAGGCFNKFTGNTYHPHTGINIDDLKYIHNLNIENSIDYINGASIFITRDAISINGLLNINFFMYYEDVEYCIRGTKNGLKLLWAKDSLVYHKESSTVKKINMGINNSKRYAWIDSICLRNKVFMILKHYPLYIPSIIFIYIIKVIKCIIIRNTTRIPIIMTSLFKGIALYLKDKTFARNI